MFKVAIIGAGMAGLSAAGQLHQQADVHIFEKSWRAGGRLTTRHKDYIFDHGAQHFYVKTKAFEAFLAPYMKQSIVQRWDARFVEFDGDHIIARRRWNEAFPHYVAVPGMEALGRTVARNYNIQYQTRITQIVRQDQHWALFSDDIALGLFDWVVLAIPAPQAAALMPVNFVHLDQIKVKKMQACYSLMLGYKNPLRLDFDAALIKNRDISWISVNSSKPGRHKTFTLLAHSTNHWADQHTDLNRESAIEHLVNEVENVIQQNVSSADHIDLHRWLYANIGRQSGQANLVDYENRLAAIGDWCISGRVESAFTSGHTLKISPM